MKHALHILTHAAHAAAHHYVAHHFSYDAAYCEHISHVAVGYLRRATHAAIILIAAI